ncbi:hypothetical protein BC835DRAFT_415302 [Cytidiella melzeri]|nr:hypothetical protein BC835DRAFT_415302 [Cytidiella melzeri]
MLVASTPPLQVGNASSSHSPSPTSLSPGTPTNAWKTDFSSSHLPSPTSSDCSLSSSDSTPLVSSPGRKAPSRAPSRRTKASKVTRRNRGPLHVPRPRNPFMIFRTEFYRNKKSSLGFEKDHRHISRIIAHCWNNLSDSDKKPWYEKALAEKEAHARKYPDYQYIPLQRTEPVKKRNVKRNGANDLLRCATVATLLGQGKEGKDLVSALEKFDLMSPPTEGKTVDATHRSSTSTSSRSARESAPKQPIFRSPLITAPELVPSVPPARPSLQVETQPTSVSPAEPVLPASDLSTLGMPQPEAHILPFTYDVSSVLPDCTTSFPLAAMHMPYGHFPSGMQQPYDGFSHADTTSATPWLDVAGACTPALPDTVLFSLLYDGGMSFPGLTSLPNTTHVDNAAAYPDDIFVSPWVDCNYHALCNTPSSDFLSADLSFASHPLLFDASDAALSRSAHQ